MLQTEVMSDVLPPTTREVISLEIVALMELISLLVLAGAYIMLRYIYLVF